jgi:hypothetical protein
MIPLDRIRKISVKICHTHCPEISLFSTVNVASLTVFNYLLSVTNTLYYNSPIFNTLRVASGFF